MTQRRTVGKRLSNVETAPERTGSSCPFVAGWDHSPAGKQKRADTLRATIPPEVAAQVQGLIVLELGLCIAKFAAVTKKPEERMELDEAVYRLANGSPLGMLNAFIEFENGEKIWFECMKFLKFIPAPRKSRGKTKIVKARKAK